MKKYKIKMMMPVTSMLIDKAFTYILKPGDVLEEKAYAYISKNNVWFDKGTVENNPELFELIIE